MGAYRVCITYREPTFELQRSWGPRPYRGIFIVRARTIDAAELRARVAFAAIAARSRVSWVREIVGVQVDEVAEDVTERLDGAAA